MSINPLKPHYAMENPASVYDEEALTALELAGRTTAKVNEVVTKVNRFTEDMTENHEAMARAIPEMVAKDVQAHIENGAFDNQINVYAGNLEARLDNLVANGSDECTDIRTGSQGFKFGTAGNAVREQYEHAIMGGCGFYKLYTGSINSDDGKFYYPVTNRVVSSLIDMREVVYIHTNDLNRHFRLFYYGKDLSYIGHSAWTKFMAFDSLDEQVKYIRFVVANIDESELTPTQVENSSLMVVTRDFVKGLGYKETPVPFINGTVTSEGEICYRANRLLSPIMPVNFLLAVPGKNALQWHILMAFYDENVNFMGCSEFTYNAVTPFNADIANFIGADAKYMRIVARVTDNLDITPDDQPLVTLYTNDATMLDDWNKNAPAFLHETMYTAYSDVNLARINSLEHFKCASHMGFNALKGDVQITADGELVMCHDNGYTLDSDMYIGEFNPDVCTLWSDVSWDEIDGEYARDDTGIYSLIRLHDYLRVCAETGKIAYITLRNINIPTLVNKVIQTVTNMGMINRCVINSYTFQTLETVRKYSRTIPVSLVLDHGATLTNNHITKVQALGNGIVTLFYYPDSATGKSMLANSLDQINRAHACGVVVHMAQVNAHTDISECVKFGVTGFHVIRCILPYTPKQYSFTVTVTADDLKIECWWNLFNPVRFGVGDIVGDAIKVQINDLILKRLLTLLPSSVNVQSVDNPGATIYTKDGDIYINHQSTLGKYTVTITV